jgi:hypothetical protein
MIVHMDTNAVAPAEADVPPVPPVSYALPLDVHLGRVLDMEHPDYVASMRAVGWWLQQHAAAARGLATSCVGCEFNHLARAEAFEHVASQLRAELGPDVTLAPAPAELLHPEYPDNVGWATTPDAS